MRFLEFQMLNDKLQYEAVWEHGVHIDHIVYNHIYHQLYAINDFFKLEVEKLVDVKIDELKSKVRRDYTSFSQLRAETAIEINQELKKLLEKHRPEEGTELNAFISNMSLKVFSVE